ncbi:MAG: TIGR02147 family protein [Bdellovibrionota bacterium]
MRHTDYRSLLQDEFRNRNHQRSQLSMNAFARFIGITPGHFNDLLKKRRGLSEEKAKSIAQKLKLPPFEKEFFVLSVKSQHSRSKSEREEAVERLENMRGQKVKVVKLDLFSLISEWQHFAILELTRLDGFRMDASWIAKQLGLEPKVAKASVDRLISLGLLKDEDGKWEVHKGILETTNDIPSLAVKSHHSQSMNLARKALYEQDVAKREYMTVMLAFDETKLEQAKEKIRRFKVEMSDLLTTSSKSRNSLYCLAVQFFSLKKL